MGRCHRGSRDAGIIAEAAEALSGYAVNDARGLIRADDAAVRATSLRQRVASSGFVEPSATWILYWYFEDPWDRTISPLSAITVNDYIVERLKRCTDEARSEVESHFLGHPLLKIKQFCPGTAAPDATLPLSPHENPSGKDAESSRAQNRNSSS